MTLEEEKLVKEIIERYSEGKNVYMLLPISIDTLNDFKLLQILERHIYYNEQDGFVVDNSIELTDEEKKVIGNKLLPF